MSTMAILDIDVAYPDIRHETKINLLQKEEWENCGGRDLKK